MDGRALFTNVVTFSDATLPALEAKMNLFLEGQGVPILTDKARIVDLVIRPGATGFYGYITFTE